MGDFFVGQRVRVVRSPGAGYTATSDKRLEVGDEATVAGTMSRPNAGFLMDDPDVDISIAPDRYPGLVGMVPSYTIEPIVTNGGASEYTYTELMDRLKAGEVERV